jgi:poly(glycerol-phosphate) alpha-glucosyltransferase
MRIGQLLTSLSHRNGGVSALARGLARSLREHGAAVEVFGVEDGQGGLALHDWLPLRPHLSRRAGPAALAHAPGQVAELLAARLDVLHTHGLWTSQSLRSLAWARSTGRPYLVSTHGMLDAWALRRAAGAKRVARWLFEDRHLRNAACLHALCASEADAIRSQGYRGAVCEIPPAVELPPADAPEPPRWATSLEAGSAVLLYLGRLHPKKGLAGLIGLWAEARRASPGPCERWVLVVAGWDQLDHRGELEALARARGVERSVRFVGPAFGAERAATYRAAQAFVLPSLSEGVPLTVLEAWSHGLPVLMTDACHLPEGFAEGAALRLRSADSHGLLSMLGASDAERAGIGARGRRLVERRFTWAVVAAQFLAVYAWLAGGGPRPETVRAT